jgi:alpha-tubulin suppressor-like RCC1 family protein
MRTTHRIFIIISLVTPIFVFPTKADYRNDSKAIAVSGGEDHTLVLTGDKGAWACGPNGDILYGTYSGVLGTGSNVSTLIEKTLVRVHDGDMETASEYIEGIYAIGAGWKHSLALDVNAFVWSWGDNFEGQLGINSQESKTSPVQVLRGEQAPADPNNPDPNLARIIAISAGRSGEHSLALDVNNLVYGWGKNQKGQCGNGESGTGYRELVPVRVLRGQQPQDPADPCDLLTRIIAVSAGEQHSMGLEAYDPCDPNLNGRVFTWGHNGPGWGGGPGAQSWEQSVGGKKIFKILNFCLDMDVILCFSA